MRNAFGDVIPALDAIVRDPDLCTYIRRTLTEVLRAINPTGNSVAEQIVEGTQKSNSLEEYELASHLTLEWNGYTKERIAAARKERAQRIVSQIQPHVQGSVLDLGCGSGQVGTLLAERHPVVLTDIYPNEQAAATGLEFQVYDPQLGLRDPRMYDTTLLLTVLHHSDDPLGTLEEAVTHTKEGGRLVVIESVYDVRPFTEHSGVVSREFKMLTPQRQRKATIFFDHFSNRVQQYSDVKINMPFNFATPRMLNDAFVKFGLRPIYFEPLGFDQPTVGEYHMLFVLKK